MPQQSVLRTTILLCTLMLLLYYFFNNTASSNEEKRTICEPSNQIKSVLVTGAAGFVGHHLIMKLKHIGVNVIGIDNFNTYYDVSLKYKRSNISQLVKNVDVCDLDGMSSLIADRKITHVIHLAAQAGVRYSLTNPQAYVKSNVECFVQLLETIKQKNINLIYASSSSVYGSNTKVPFAESDPVDHPVSLYAATKRENELIANVYWNLYKQRSIGLRFFTVYGPLGRPDMAYFSFVKNIESGKPIQVYNHGKLSRDFTYIDDVVSGVAACLDACYDVEIVNLGRGHPERLTSFIEIIEKGLGKKAVTNYVEMAKGDVLTTYADVRKAYRILGYKPKVSLNEGMSNFITWYKDYYRNDATQTK